MSNRKPTKAVKAQEGSGDILEKKEVWGRAASGTWGASLGAAFMMGVCPWLAAFFVVTIQSYGGSLTASLTDLLGFVQGGGFGPGFDFLKLHWVIPMIPRERTLIVFFSWLAFQFLLAVLVPGNPNPGYGQATPAGHTLPYNVNGIRCWVITHAVLYVAVYQLKLFKGSILFDEWGALFVVANCWGFALTLFAYIKARVAPSHPADCKYSGSIMYDMFMGVEQNPRFGDWFDFKLFYNGRPGILAWSLINFSMGAKQYELYGEVTNSMVLINVLHLIYILDYFWNEDWYLRTIDIAHDHFGFYLAWGDCVWLPWLYTLQAFYLVQNPVKLSDPIAYGVLALGFAGYFVFRSVNAQKNDFRKANGKCNIWGKPAKYLVCTYKTFEGPKTSMLLLSGWWGLSRHFNYVGDLMMSLSFCLCCGFTHLLPYFYIIYMTILLVHRVERDSSRLAVKYGAKWDEYCGIVKYKILPPFY